tara:strand:+ start:5948 stop:6514 length:567 start_codon:yes stop_codon:yes gene_type:complete
VVKIEVVTQPTQQVVNFDDLRDHLRIETHDDDALLVQYLDSATAQAENYTGLHLRSQTIKLWFDHFPTDSLKLYAAPFMAITRVDYYDTDNALQTYALSDVDVDLYQGLIRPYPTKTWPDTYDRYNAVGIEATVGYTAATLPVAIRQAILMMAGHFYENREATAPRAAPKSIEFGFKALLDPYRRHTL